MNTKKIFNFFLSNLKKNPKKKFIFDGSKFYDYLSIYNFFEEVKKQINIANIKNIILISDCKISFLNILLVCSKMKLSFTTLSYDVKIEFLKKILNLRKFETIIIDKKKFELLSKEERLLIFSSVKKILLINNKKLYIKLNKKNKTIRNNFFYLSFTSGSTGSPKGICLSEEKKILRSLYVRDLYNLTENDKILVSTPLYHTLGFRMLILNLILNSTCIIKIENKSDLENIIKKFKISFAMMVPSQLVSLFQNTTNLKKISIKNLVCSSSKFDLYLKKKIIKNLNGSLHEIYGLSETSIITNINLSKEPKKINSVGKTIKNVSIRVINKKRKANQVGEIYCKSPLMFNGYLKKNKVTSTKKINFFKTGDLGYIDSSGYLFFQDRKKDLMKISGVSVYPSDIEKIVSKMPQVKKCAVFSKNKKSNEEIFLIVEKKIKNKLNKRDILHYCHGKLENYQLPKHIRFVNKIHVNYLGKVNKSKLKQIYN